MDEFLTALRNIVIAMILAWIGVSFSDKEEEAEPIDDSIAQVELLQANG